MIAPSQERTEPREKGRFAMTKGVFNIVCCSMAIVGLILLGAGLGTAADNKPAAAADQLLSVGKIGPNPIDLKIGIEKPPADKASAAVSPVVKLAVSRKAYVTAIYISSNGDATILLPNKETPDNLFLHGKEYTLFGAESKIKLTADEKQKKSKIVFYASPNPLKLDPLSVPEGQDFITIPNSSLKDIDFLCGKLETLSKEEGFNRKVLALKDESGKKDALGLMGLPMDVKSGRPQSVTGVQGIKSNILETPKE
jgi:hypothetical protein